MEAVGDGVEKSRGAHALAFVIDDNRGRVGAVPVVADLDFLVAQIDGSFVASGGEAEGVVFFDLPGGLGVEEFVVVFGGREKAEASEVDAEAVDGLHADGVVFGSVVIAFDPVGELAIEGFERSKIELAHEELIADPAKESFDLSLGGGVANRGVPEDAADAGADEVCRAEL